jgi:AcrR family transcriptional regulator
MSEKAPTMSTGKTRRDAPRRDEPSARQRLIETATELFYQEGIRAIGIDTVVARSGVSKSYLYRTFASKEDLIAAFAEEQNRRFWQWWDETTARHAGAPRQQIEALFDGIAEQITNPRFRGCPFINLATEFPDRHHAGTAIACANKMEMGNRLRLLAGTLGARDPHQLGDQLALLIDGAYGHAVTLGAAGLRGKLIEMAKLLIDGQVGQEKRARHNRPELPKRVKASPAGGR